MTRHGASGERSARRFLNAARPQDPRGRVRHDREPRASADNRHFDRYLRRRPQHVKYKVPSSNPGQGIKLFFKAFLALTYPNLTSQGVKVVTYVSRSNFFGLKYEMKGFSI